MTKPIMPQILCLMKASHDCVPMVACKVVRLFGGSRWYRCWESCRLCFVESWKWHRDALPFPLTVGWRSTTLALAPDASSIDRGTACTWVLLPFGYLTDSSFVSLYERKWKYVVFRFCFKSNSFTIVFLQFCQRQPTIPQKIKQLSEMILSCKR